MPNKGVDGRRFGPEMSTSSSDDNSDGDWEMRSADGAAKETERNKAARVDDDTFVDVNYAAPPSSGDDCVPAKAVASIEHDQEEQKQHSHRNGRHHTQHHQHQQQHASESPLPVRDPRECVVVDTSPYRAAGFAACACLAVTFGLVTVKTTAAWCDPAFAAFWLLLLETAAVDVVVAQPLLLAGTALWRWLTAAEEDDEEDDDDDNRDQDDGSTGTLGSSDTSCTQPQAKDAGKKRAPPLSLRFDAHPIHGQWRHVGPLVVAFDHADFDDATPPPPPPPREETEQSSPHQGGVTTSTDADTDAAAAPRSVARLAPAYDSPNVANNNNNHKSPTDPKALEHHQPPPRHAEVDPLDVSSASD